MARRSSKAHKRAKSRAKACRGRRKVRARWSSKRCKRTYHKAKRHGRGRRHSRRNPGGMERTLRDGTSLSLHRDGDHGVLYIHHADGSMDDFKGSWNKAVAKFKAFKSGHRYGRRAESSAWRELAMDNPRHRRGRKSRRNCMNPSDDPRYATTKIIRKGNKRNCGMGMRRNMGQFPGPFAEPFVTFLNPRRKGRGRKSRRNPAQFPMPFTSAMNPYRTRRNFPINRKQARTMGKVLRQHGYKKCRV